MGVSFCFALFLLPAYVRHGFLSLFNLPNLKKPNKVLDTPAEKSL
jgi:hypothetical protein